MKIVWIMMLVLLQGCGGGGGGDGESNSSPVADSLTETVTDSSPQIEPVALRDMQDLSIPDGFSYGSVETYQLEVSVSELFSKRSYLSIYTEFLMGSDGTYQANNGSKVTAVPLESGEIEVSFSLPSATSEFLVEIWSYDGNPPLQRVFQTAEERATWQE